MKTIYKTSITLCFFLVVFAMFLGIAGADDGIEVPGIEVPEPEYVSIYISPVLRADLNNMLGDTVIQVDDQIKATNMINGFSIDLDTGHETPITSCDIVSHDASTGIDTPLGQFIVNTDDNTFTFIEAATSSESIYGTYDPTFDEITFLDAEGEIEEVIPAYSAYLEEESTLILEEVCKVNSTVEEAP